MAHDSMLAEFSHLLLGQDGVTGAEVVWKPHVSAWPRRTRNAEADVGFYRLPGLRDTELNRREKHREHPVFDAGLRRRVPFDFVALNF